ncbi:MAG: hypothetical protein WBX01_07900 [Nitrososphaeraceae archaeon]
MQVEDVLSSSSSSSVAVTACSAWTWTNALKPLDHKNIATIVNNYISHNEMLVP